jgi:Outer membrane protein beta-barrel domain
MGLLAFYCQACYHCRVSYKLGLWSAADNIYSATLNAQEHPWSFGTKLGLSWSLLTRFDELVPGLGNENNQLKTTTKVSSDKFLAGGLTAGYAFHKNVGVGLEVLYARLGGKLERSTELPTGGTNQGKAANPYKLQVLSHNVAVPVMLKLFPMGCDPDRGILTIDLGFQALFPISVDVKHTEPIGDKGNFSDKLEKFKDEDGKEFDKSAQFTSMTGGFISGLSYELPEVGLTIETRGYFGMSDTLKNDSEAKKYRKEKMNLAENKNVRNNYATFSVGYNFARLLVD